jgi:hypothetical protein
MYNNNNPSPSPGPGPSPSPVAVAVASRQSPKKNAKSPHPHFPLPTAQAAPRARRPVFWPEDAHLVSASDPLLPAPRDLMHSGAFSDARRAPRFLGNAASRRWPAEEPPPPGPGPKTVEIQPVGQNWRSDPQWSRAVAPGRGP